MISIIDLEVKDFCKELKNMIDNGSSCSEMYDKISEQSDKIQKLFEGMHIMTLKYGKDLIFKEQLTEIRFGIDIHKAPANPINEYDRFLGFLNSKIFF